MPRWLVLFEQAHDWDDAGLQHALADQQRGTAAVIHQLDPLDVHGLRRRSNSPARWRSLRGAQPSSSTAERFADAMRQSVIRER